MILSGCCQKEEEEEKEEDEEEALPRSSRRAAKKPRSKWQFFSLSLSLCLRSRNLERADR